MPDMIETIETIEDLRRLCADGATEIEDILPPLHPGEVLREEFMLPLEIDTVTLAKALRLPRSRIERIAREEIGITTDTALRLGRYFGTTHQFWINLQTRFESETLLRRIGPELDRIEPRGRAA